MNLKNIAEREKYELNETLLIMNKPLLPPYLSSVKIAGEWLVNVLSKTFWQGGSSEY